MIICDNNVPFVPDRPKNDAKHDKPFVFIRPRRTCGCGSESNATNLSCICNLKIDK